ncbi:MAG: DUF6599 family protein [Bryobacteraceae bacterium]
MLTGLLAPALAPAAIWPDTWGEFQRSSAQPAALTGNRELWTEYGLEAAERARYEKGNESFTATAYRLRDSTGAMAAYLWKRPADFRPSNLALLAVEHERGVMLAKGNYVLDFEGYTPQAAELERFFEAVPRLEVSSLPALKDYLPEEGRQPGSERYMNGPIGLETFEPRIPLASAAFHLSTEGYMARYGPAGKEMPLLVFSYPTPAMAREHAEELQKVPGAMVKRSGPLVAIVVQPPDPNEAERLLGKVRYNATITWNERVPTQKDNWGFWIYNSLLLVGILSAFSVLIGLLMYGMRAFYRRTAHREVDGMTRLGLEDRPRG